MAVPIVVGESICGILQLANRRSGTPYTPRDKELLRIFAAYMSSSIQNALDAIQQYVTRPPEKKKKRAVHRLAGVLREHPGQRPRLLVAAIRNEAGHHRRGQEHKERNHHGTAAGAMPEIALGAEQDEVVHIADGRGGSVDKVGEARAGWPDEAPNHARHDQKTDHIARPDMHGEQIVFGEIGDGEAHDEAPMEQPHKRVHT